MRVENITFHDDNKITLNFLGKDSIEYNNTVGIEPKVNIVKIKLFLDLHKLIKFLQRKIKR